MIDHNHDTGEVRGVLCSACNSLIGYAKDSIETLEEAVRYLSKNTSSLGGINACGEESSDVAPFGNVKLSSVKQEIAGLRRDAQTL